MIFGFKGLPLPPNFKAARQSVSLVDAGTECGWCGEVFEGNGSRSNEGVHSSCSSTFTNNTTYSAILRLSRRPSEDFRAGVIVNRKKVLIK